MAPARERPSRALYFGEYCDAVRAHAFPCSRHDNTCTKTTQTDTAHHHAFTTSATLTTIMKYSLAGVAGLAALAAAQGTWPSDIVGTWSTKSNKTLTGPV